VNWKGDRLYLAEFLARQPMGFRQIDEDEWELFYGPILLGEFLIRNGKPAFRRVA
jgi:hypothetical protein